MKQLRVGVHHLRLYGEPGKNLADAVSAIQALPDDESRAAILKEDAIRPRGNIFIGPEYCLLDFNRFQETDRIDTGNIQGFESSITFGPDDPKPLTRTAVLLDHKADTMFIHERQEGIGHTLIAKYLRATKVFNEIVPELVLHEGGLERLLNKEHSKFKVQLAGMQSSGNLRAHGSGDGAILDLVKAFRSPKATISLELERENNNKLANVLETASALLGWNELFRKKSQRPVRSLYVTPEDGEAPINLLRDRMVHVFQVESERGKALTDADRYRAVQSAFERFSAELRRRFGARTA